MEYAIKDSHSVPLILQYPSTFLVLGFLVVEPCNFHMKAQRKSRVLVPVLVPARSYGTSTLASTVLVVP